MCRSIKPLRYTDRPATERELEEAELQYIRNISGFRKSSQVNQTVFDLAVKDIATVSQRLLQGLVVRGG